MSKQLFVFATRYIQYVAGEGDILLPGGHSSQDFAQEVVLRVLAGARSWSPQKNGDLSIHMRRQVKSLVNHSFGSWSGKHETEIPDVEDETPEETLDRISPRSISLEHLDPEQIYLDKETRTEKKGLCDLVLSAIAGDHELEAIIITKLENPDISRSGLARLLEISPSDVTNRLKKIRRMCNSVVGSKTPAA